MVPENLLIPSYTVVSRHSAKCPYKTEGRSYVKCGCRKHIAVYDPGKDPKARQSIIRTRTRSWQDAERIAQAYRDRHDPDKQRAAEAEAKLKALQMEKEVRTATIEKAIGMFLMSKKKEGVSPKRLQRYYPLLGNVDPQTFEIVRTRRDREGRLFAWLNTLTPRPVYVSDLTPELVEAFRNTWDFPSDLTQYNSFGDIKAFFNYCLMKRWISEHPMAGMKAPKKKKGSRTTAFSDQQYDSIVAAIKSRFSARLPNDQFKDLEDRQRYEEALRLLAFVELQRWGGLALGDAITFKLDSMKDTGEVRYRRHKSGKLARPTLQPHVVTLLKTIVPVDGYPNEPFYDKNIKLDSNKGRWTRALKDVFEAAGIESVKTDIRERDPHDHMLRDTFAIGQLRTQYELGMVNHQAIADALGDTIKIFLEHYAPWIAEFEQAHADAQRKIIEAQRAKLEQKQAENGQKVVNIGDRK
jgi:hypothetical protein